MIKLLFMLPLGLSIVWFLYLKQFGYTFQQGKKGFLYILAFSACIGGFYAILLWLTHR